MTSTIVSMIKITRSFLRTNRKPPRANICWSRIRCHTDVAFLGFVPLMLRAVSRLARFSAGVARILQCRGPFLIDITAKI